MVVNVLRSDMFNSLPVDVKAMFPVLEDPQLGPVPNIFTGHIAEMGANVSFPAISVSSRGAAEALTRGRYRHITAEVDYWSGAGQTQNLDGRKIVSILYEYSFQALQDKNFSSDNVLIKRCYEIERSDTMFEPTDKLYHINNVYRIEALSSSWY